MTCTGCQTQCPETQEERANREAWNRYAARWEAADGRRERLYAVVSEKAWAHHLYARDMLAIHKTNHPGCTL